MQSLEQLISEWRASMRGKVDADSMEELEEHLREGVARHVKDGMPVDEAFHAAAKRLGAGDVIEGEFRKVAFADWWAVKVSLIVGALVVGLAAILLFRFSDRQFGWALGPHVAAVTIGFIATYLTGALGIAYVIEQFFSEVSSARLRLAARTATTYSGIAAILTTVAIVLGMIWAKLAWGRYWAWDPKETGAFGVLVWQALFFLGGRSRLVPPRVLMLLAIFGNIVLSFGWFAPTQSFHILTPLVAVHLIFLLAGVMINFGPNARARSQV